MDTANQDGVAIAELVRDAQAATDAFSDLTVEYRFGMVQVSFDGDVVLEAYIANGQATVRAITIEASRAPCTLTQFGAETTRTQTRDLTDEEMAQLASADRDYARLVELYQAGAFAAATKIGEKLLPQRKSLLGERHPDYIELLNNMGELYRLLGQFQRAEPLFQSALKLRESLYGTVHPETNMVRTNLANMHYNMANYDEAEKLLQQAQSVCKQVLGTRNADYANTLNTLGTIRHGLGDYDGAIRYFRECLEIRKVTLGETHPYYAGTLDNLGRTYQFAGDYAKAAPLLQEATRIRRSVLGEQHPGYAAGLHSLASLYDDMGDYARAERLYHQAADLTKSLLGEDHPKYSTILNNLAGLYVSRHNLTKAESLYQQALKIDRAALGETSPEYVTTLNNLGELYWRMGEYKRARPYFHQASDALETLVGPRHPEYITTVNNLGATSLYMRHLDTAETLLRQAHDAYKVVLGEHHPLYATSLSMLATVYDGRAEYSDAASHSDRAVALLREKLDHESVLQSERQQKRQQSKLRAHFDKRLSIGLRSKTASRSILESLWRWKGSVTLRQQAYRKVASDPTLRPTFSSLQLVSRQLSAHTGEIPIAPAGRADAAELEAWKRSRKQWDEQFAVLSRRREELEQRIAADSLPFRELQVPLTVDAVQQLLPPGTALLDFLEFHYYTPVTPVTESDTNSPHKPATPDDGQRNYIAFLVRAGRDPVMLNLGSGDSLDALIEAFREPFVRGSASPKSEDAGRKLRDRLWAPLETYLDGINTVVISPDSMVGTVPFAALPTKSKGRFLVEQYRFVSLLLVAMQRSMGDRKPQSVPRLLTVADVAFGAPLAGAGAEAPGADSSDQPSLPSGRRWRALPAAGKELADVSRLFESRFSDGAITALKEDAATEVSFMRAAPSHTFLHLITHGFFAGPEIAVIGQGGQFDPVLRTQVGRDPTITQYLPGLLSGLILAGANNPPERGTGTDGVLTASEIETLDLSGVDLAVLSACETGLGRTGGGEGLTGLQRAFHIAGARTVLASLWKVDDRAPQALMSRFYANLWNTEKPMSKLDALHEAQIWMLNNPVLPDGTELRGDPLDRERAAVSNEPESQSQRTDPRYWAAFVLSGDWR